MTTKIRLSDKSNVLDRIDLSLTPYLEEPISLIGHPKIQWEGILGPTQSAKSVFLQAAVADMVYQDPGPGLYVLPDENVGKKHFEEKVISMIKNSPELAKYQTGKVRDMCHERVTLQHMTIYPAWAGSIATMNSFPMKRVFLDEVRLMPLTTGNESNAIKLSGDRLTTYQNFGLAQGYIVSTPSVEGDLLHQQLSVPGTLYLSWQVQCQICGEYQELDFFENFIKVDGKRGCFCKYCKAEFDESDSKRKINSTGKYAVVQYDGNERKPTKIYPDGTREVPFVYGEGHSRVFFHWSSMDSPFRSYWAIWDEYLKTKDKLHDYKNFWQAWLGRFWIDDQSQTSSSGLEACKKAYRSKTVPPWVRLLTAGIDTQDAGFYVVIRGWGANFITGVVDAFYIPCPIMTASAKDILKKFKELIFDRVIDGWKVTLAALDTGGHRTKTLYDVCSTIPNILMCKGATENQNVNIKYNEELNLYLVRTPVYLEETDNRSSDPEKFLLPDNISKDFICQYVNRRKVKEYNKKTGESKTIWKKIGQDDYRYADVHSFICLDVPTAEFGNLRENLDVDTFSNNPYEQEIKLKKQLEDKAKRTSLPDEDMFDAETDDFVPDVKW